MTLDISLAAEAEKRLRERAVAAGVDVRSCAQQLLEDALRESALDEMLAPLRARFSKSGISEDQLADDLEREKHALREEKRRRVS